MQQARTAGRRAGDGRSGLLGWLERAPRGAVIAGVGLVAAILLVALATTISNADRAGRQSLEERAAQRTLIARRFVEASNEDLQASIEAHGEAALAGDVRSPVGFELVNQMMRFRAGVLLDDQGRVIQSYPADPELVGQDLTGRFDHLRRAVAGETVVTGVVPSVVEGEPIVAFAVPYDTPSGRRVFSAGYRVEDTPLGAYLRNATVLPGEALYLVDDAGNLIASSEVGTGPDPDPAAGPGGFATLAERDGALAAAAATGDQGTYTAGGEDRFFTAQDIDGAPWRLVRVLPSEAMYAPADEGRWVPWLLFVGFAVVGAASLVMLGSIIGSRDRERRRATRDPLTGLANRRSLDAALGARMTAAPGSAWAVIMIDVDHFKAVNDTFGHSRGDEVLAGVAETVQGAVRPGDLAGRWGGEEFMVVVPGASLAIAASLAERIRSSVEAMADADPVVTVSIGYASTEQAPADGLVDLADAALYRAKETGRNRCVTLSPAEAFPALAAPEPV